MPSIYLVDSVSDAYDLLQEQQAHPEMMLLSRVLTLGGPDFSYKRHNIDMGNLYDTYPDPDFWARHAPSMLKEAVIELDDYYIAMYEANPSTEIGSLNSAHILSYTVALNRQRTMVLQMINSYLDVTRTHPETFYNTFVHRERYDGIKKTFFDAVEFLNSAPHP